MLSTKATCTNRTRFSPEHELFNKVFFSHVHKEFLLETKIFKDALKTKDSGNKWKEITCKKLVSVFLYALVYLQVEWKGILV